MKQIICFDIGGTKVKHGVLTEKGKILEQGSYPTEIDDHQIFMDAMIATIKTYRQAYAVAGIAMSFPGYVDADTGYIERAGAIRAMDKVNVIKMLSEETGLPVAVENDANCVALAEKFLGNAQECDDFVCMTIGTGIGGGIFLNGEILRGKRWRAGEFGMMVMSGLSSECKTMHDTAATAALIDTYKKFKGLDKESLVEGQQIFEEAGHDPFVQALVDDWLTYISFGIFNLVCTLSPEKVLIGGGVSAKDGLLELIEKKLAKLPLWEDFRTPLAICHFKNDAGLIGALYHYLSKHEVEVKLDPFALKVQTRFPQDGLFSQSQEKKTLKKSIGEG